MATLVGYPFRDLCVRCDHTSDEHRLDDAQNVGPTDPEAKFRCLGVELKGGCDCPDMVRSEQNLKDLEKESTL